MEKSNFSTQRVLDRGGEGEIRFVIGFVGRETWLPRDQSIFRAVTFYSGIKYGTTFGQVAMDESRKTV